MSKAIIIVLIASLSANALADPIDQLLPTADALLGDNIYQTETYEIIPATPDTLVPNTPALLDLTYPIDPLKPDCVFPQPETEVTPEDFVNLSLEDAINLAEANGKTTRVTRRDGESFPTTMDYRTDRVNFQVDEGIVTSCTQG